ncbi:alpha-ketoglutarate-dependent dioxygenase AlkB family protein [Chryseobacterium sp. SC28]|uniref:alpha-ketoglutarate-dependent dioxygenase AlkB family protein n=1 Tax=Chryseobacterium sp. SC28 TaxID=2268028 RepID=UPI000F651142|nr:alpha-ketoglutarate-dependent dioxygenase AlkB [Chryseobacterium sp. SC28]RRQ45090.1 alpha-ketoglutarate-dependent dioxygenase AlkB [Chryseobacterium sp. SC28]
MDNNIQADLFGQTIETPNPIIKLKDAELLYHPAFFDKAESDRIFKTLLETIEWKQDKIMMYGKELPLPRLSAWYGDNNKPYTYSGITLNPLPWTDELLQIKEKIEAEAKVKFSSVLLNRYRDGQDYVGWHTDAEKELGKNPIIGSVNFGATRKFQLRRIDDHKEKFEVELKHGTFLVMGGTTQHFWQHQVPKTAHKIGERLNLTFRVIY